VLVVGSVVVTWVHSEGAARKAGPLRQGSASRTLSSGPALLGQWVVTSVFSDRLAGSAPAVIDAVRPSIRGQAAGLKLRYAVLPSRARGSPWFLRGWPPPGYGVVPLHGYTLHPGEALTVVVGAAALGRGRWRITGFDMIYHVGTRHYVATFSQGVALRTVTHCVGCLGSSELAGRLGGA